MNRRGSSLRTMQSVLQSLLSRGKFAESMRQAQLHQAWQETVGPKSGARSRPLSLSKGRLLIGVDSAPLMQELSMQTEALLASMKAKLTLEQVLVVRFKAQARTKLDKEGNAT